ncbi:MAG: esterase family protein [Bacteroides sp.]|nr:esterase family protein [Bacteroides sp.]MCM1413293.1 esterase family protein [Bacteroides sp.]MCM1471397.1 esterase family protein [Bacteroides sp.]
MTRQIIRRLLTAVGIALPALLSMASVVREVPTHNIPGPAPVTIAVPTDYSNLSESTYPVVYLLNGHGGDHKSWGSVINIDSLADAYGVIIVCPSGLNSWYWDSPVDPKMRMESYIIDDLVPWVDAEYRTTKSRDERAITGLSMGGHGALWLALRHPDLFGNAGSTSGGVDFRPWPKSWNIPDRLGSYESNPMRWTEHTVMSLVPMIIPGQVNIIFDCGTDDFFYDVNCTLDRELNQRRIPHAFLTSPGGHTPSYWHQSIGPQMDFFARHFREHQSTIGK